MGAIVTRTCQHCGASTDDDALTTCPSCGQPLAAPAEGSYGTQPPPPYASQPPPYGSQPSPYGTPPPYGTPAFGTPPSSETSSQRPAVLFDRAVTTKVSRLRVFFRFLLAIPHFVILYLYGIVAGLAAIAAWFVALFTGRVSDGLYDFLGGFVAYSTRVMSYTWLLTDQWPTVDGKRPYPIVFQPPGPGRLNRAAVFFRLILYIPANIVRTVVLLGAYVCGFFIWLITLVIGRVPVPAFDALATSMRYQARADSYYYLLTSAYPAGLFGDDDDRSDTQPVEGPRPPIVVGGARRLVTAFLILGVLVPIGIAVVTAVLVGSSTIIKAEDADQALVTAYESMKLQPLAACNTAADRLSCVREAAQQDADVIRHFQSDVHAIDFPSDDANLVSAMNQAAQKFLDDLNAIAGATSLQALSNVISGNDLQGDGQAFDSAVNALGQRLDSQK